ALYAPLPSRGWSQPTKQSLEAVMPCLDCPWKNLLQVLVLLLLLLVVRIRTLRVRKSGTCNCRQQKKEGTTACCWCRRVSWFRESLFRSLPTNGNLLLPSTNSNQRSHLPPPPKQTARQTR